MNFTLLPKQMVRYRLSLFDGSVPDNIRVI